MPEVTHEQPTPTSPEDWRFGARSFRTKIVATTVALMAAAMLVVGLGIQLLLARTAQGDVDGVLVDRAAAMITVVDQASKGGVVTVPQASLSPGVLVYTADGVLVAGSVEPEAREQAERLSRTTTMRYANGPDDKTRLLGKPFTTSRGVKGVVVVSAETTPYERSERYALVATAALGVLVVVASALIALRVTRTALRPVAQMAERAADWSEHDLEHRFDLGPPTNELAALGGILDRLLDRVASVILAEQRLTAELAHELRTPLTSIKGSADLALMRGVADPEVRRELEQISESAQSMAGVITTLLDISRDGAAQSTQRSCLAVDVLRDVASDAVLAARAGVTVTVDGAASAARIPAPRELVVRAVQPLVDNAVHHAASRVVLAATDRGDWVELSVADDGTGIAPQARERLFEPGVSQREGGAGLGLGIARRVARSLGGDVTVQPPADGDPGGARFVVALPRR